MSGSPVIAIIGAGAVGGYYGARLAQHGHNVHFLLRSDYHAVKQNGWQVRSWAGDFSVPPQRLSVHNDPGHMPRADLVLVALKTTSNEQFEPLIGPLLKENTAILTLQNGLGNEEQLASLFGVERVLGGMAFVCSNRLAPGVIHHIDHGIIRFGELNGGPTDRTRRIAQWFSSSEIPAEVLDNLMLGKWMKLVWNIPFNGLGTVLDLSTDRLIDNEAGLEMVRGLMQEVIDGATAQGLTMPPDLIQRMLKHTHTMGAYLSSMQIDRREGRPLEVEAILGEPLRRAQQRGVATPRLAMLYHMVRLLDPANVVARDPKQEGGHVPPP